MRWLAALSSRRRRARGSVGGEGGGVAGSFAGALGALSANNNAEFSPDDVPAGGTSNSWPDTNGVYTLSSGPPSYEWDTVEGEYAERKSGSRILNLEDNEGFALDEFTFFLVLDAAASPVYAIRTAGGNMQYTYWSQAGSTAASWSVTVPSGKFLYRISGRASDSKRSVSVGAGPEELITSSWAAAATSYPLGIGNTSSDLGMKVYGFCAVKAYMDSNVNADVLAACESYLNGVHGL